MARTVVARVGFGTEGIACRGATDQSTSAPSPNAKRMGKLTDAERGWDDYHPSGQHPPGRGVSIRVVPPGSSSVSGLEHVYWVQTNANGQRIGPTTRRTGTRGKTHIPMPPPRTAR